MSLSLSLSLSAPSNICYVCLFGAFLAEGRSLLTVYQSRALMNYSLGEAGEQTVEEISRARTARAAGGTAQVMCIMTMVMIVHTQCSASGGNH